MPYKVGGPYVIRCKCGNDDVDEMYLRRIETTMFNIRSAENDIITIDSHHEDEYECEEDIICTRCRSVIDGPPDVEIRSI